MEHSQDLGPEYVDLGTGDTVILTTGSDTTYEITDVSKIDGSLTSTVQRHPPSSREGRSPGMILDKATFFSPDLSHEGFPIRRIHRGKILKIIGIDRATNETIEIKTTPIESITPYHQPELEA